MSAEAPALPAGLAPWAPALAELDVELATALGPMVRRLDHLIAARDRAPNASEGEFAGWNGISRRGQPSRLLVSEWGIADAVPEEFVRRAASAELMYLQPGYEQPRPRGEVGVLLDTGPDLLGAARLVQLAVLVVLQRRAHSAASAVRIGLLGDPPGAWIVGGFADALGTWLAGRRTHAAVEDVQQWQKDLTAPDELWLIGGDQLAAASPHGSRLLVVRESAWDADGAVAVEVILRGTRLELALPRPELAIRALRSPRRRPDVRAARSGHAARAPLFSGVSARLLMRGAGDAELIGASMPRGDGTQGRPRTYRFGGAVVGAAVVGQRVVTLVRTATELGVEIVGKPLGRLTELRIPFDRLPAGELDVDTARLAPVHFDRGSLLWSGPSGWWRFDPHGEVRAEPDIRAVVSSERTDQPIVAMQGVGPDTFIHLAADGTRADSADGQRWTCRPDDVHIAVPDGDVVLGVTRLAGQPVLVSLSSAGLVVRLHRDGRTTTLTRWSGGSGRPALHPRHPWLAVPRADGRVEVADLETGDRLWRYDSAART